MSPERTRPRPARAPLGVVIALVLAGCVSDDVIGARASCERCTTRCEPPFDVRLELRIGERAALAPDAPDGAITAWESLASDVASVDGSGVVRGEREGTAIVVARRLDGLAAYAVEVHVRACESLCIEPAWTDAHEGDLVPLQVRGTGDETVVLEVPGATLLPGPLVQLPASRGPVAIEARTASRAARASIDVGAWTRLGALADARPRLLETATGPLVVGAQAVDVLSVTRRWQAITPPDRRVFERGAAVGPDGVLHALFAGAPREVRLEAGSWVATAGTSRDAWRLHATGGEVFAVVDEPERLWRFDPLSRAFQPFAVDSDGLLQSGRFLQTLERIADGWIASSTVDQALTWIAPDGSSMRTLPLPDDFAALVGVRADEAGVLYVTGGHRVLRWTGTAWQDVDRSAMPTDSSPAIGRPGPIERFTGSLYVRNGRWDLYRIDGDRLVRDQLVEPLPGELVLRDVVLSEGRFYGVGGPDDAPTAWRTAPGQLGAAVPRATEVRATVLGVTATGAASARTVMSVGARAPLAIEVEGPGRVVVAIDPADVVQLEGDTLVALREGRARARVVHENDPALAAEIDLEVIAPWRLSGAIELTPAALVMNVGETRALSARVVARDCGVTWPERPAPRIAFRSLEPAIATVDANGVVSAIASGRARVVAEIVELPVVLGVAEIDVRDLR